MTPAREGRADGPRPLALVLHDDRRMVGHVHEVVASEGLEALTVPTPFRMLEPRDRDVALVVIGATALDERDLELIPIVRDTYPDALVLVVHPASLRERAAATLELGADATLPEPFYPAELAAHARHAVSRARAPAQPAPQAPPPLRTPTSDDHTPVEQLALGVAHGINNPLQILELMLGSTDAGDHIDVDGVRAQLDRIRTVADDLSRVGMSGRVQRSPVDVNALVRETFGAGGSPDQPRCELDLAGGDLVVQGEPKMLREALGLLQRRAVRVTPGSGRIQVTTSATDSGAEIRVRDGGPKLADQERTRFFQPKPDPDIVQEGTWLEMAVLAGIVRHHGGTADVTTESDGTTVVLRLPGAREPATVRS